MEFFRTLSNSISQFQVNGIESSHRKKEKSNDVLLELSKVREKMWRQMRQSFLYAGEARLLASR
ncbi:hypothetical protein PHMEG_00013196 [Phytophthora megakarya]|uniref:Uncharacterized protein n=1 Tax=Phytophthora megakarya TaxID=4795 RepID=A0A225W8Z2_9STRA|nr:hypothetical protein PHMEG_00013196 [Phytophthora megakarya]